MKRKLLTATATAVACIGLLAGCTRSQLDKVTEQTVQTNPPPGDIVKVSEDGKTFMPLIGGKYYFINNPTTANYQEAVDRLWNYRRRVTTYREPQPMPNDFKWRE